MADESPRLVPMPCVQCGRPGVAQVPLDNGSYVQVCYDHYNQFEDLRIRKVEMYRQLAEDMEDNIDDTMGFPRRLRPARIPAPRVNVNQVNIHGDNLGVVNTGTVANISNSLTVIRGHDAALAAQLKTLTEAIIASTELDQAQKQEAADLLSEVAGDTAKPPEQRRTRTAMKLIASGLSQLLSHSADLYTLWTAIAPHLPQ